MDSVHIEILGIKSSHRHTKFVLETVPEIFVSQKRCSVACGQENMIQTIDVNLFLNRKHHNLSSWNLLDESGFEEVFRMTIFYLELSHERALRTAEPNMKK